MRRRTFTHASARSERRTNTGSSNSSIVSPFLARYVWHLTHRVDVDAMKRASLHLVGAHDFAAFQGAGSDVGSSQRTINTIGWEEGDARDLPIRIRIQGDGFLRHMVRNIVGTLVDVGSAGGGADQMVEILASRDRSRAGPTAPAHGLFLVCVEY